MFPFRFCFVGRWAIGFHRTGTGQTAGIGHRQRQLPERKDSSDASDFTSYSKSLPQGMQLAEAEMKARRLTRPSTPKSLPTPAAAQPAAATGFKTGLYHGFVTTNLIPGQVFQGTWNINADGTAESANAYGDRGHGKINFSDPNNITSVTTTHLGVFLGVQRRYPDGSASAETLSQGRVVNGVISGTWHDKYQLGQFQMTPGAGP
jgi:hypothetical protein